MRDDQGGGAEDLVRRLHAAMNAHDLGAFVACFAEDYDSAQPVHPERAFRGSAQVRANWSAIFADVPDFRAELVAADVAGDTAWTEWRWPGTRADGGRMDVAGVMVLRVRDDRIASARLYLEPVDDAGEAGGATLVEDITER
ncbi:nuclear transport factor 2 family protein [Baekduia soli]|uniref:Nuclear transport factor 2 family protein n=2 Tax=Baekduia soli TaxID=496014 RepID=A0A5B8UC82_9ACTN|nr:nuclear transport factor 2 family protein [Baekduia soli]